MLDEPSGKRPEAEAIEAEMKLHARSITLSSNRLGLIAKLDPIEVEDGSVVPVDYKHGKRPHVARGTHDPERDCYFARRRCSMRTCSTVAFLSSRSDAISDNVSILGAREVTRL